MKKKDKEYIENIISFFGRIAIYLSGVKFKKYEISKEKIVKTYQKYLGDDYKISFDETDNSKENVFSSYISNHLGFSEIIYLMVKYKCKLVIKRKILYIPVLGSLFKDLKSILVERGDQKSREDSLNKIVKEQKEIYESKINNENNKLDLLIFPEGCCSSDKYLCTFKKGIFINLLPLKPIIVKNDEKDDFFISSNSLCAAANFLRGMACKFNMNSYLADLPIIKPTQFMFDNNKNFGNNKATIFMETCRHIMMELGNFKDSYKGLRDTTRYKYILENNAYVSKDEYNKMLNEGKIKIEV